jgi:hypothetical protein
MKHKTAELEGALLDAAVAQAMGEKVYLGADGIWRGDHDLPLALHSRDWSYGGGLIEHEKIELEYDGLVEDWRAIHPKHYSGKLTSHASAHGETALIAAMRAFVRAKLGEEVELP